MLSTNQLWSPSTTNRLITSLGWSAVAAAHRPVASSRQDILTELLDPFDLLTCDPVDEKRASRVVPATPTAIQTPPFEDRIVRHELFDAGESYV
jgi:hypothetical protein